MSLRNTFTKDQAVPNDATFDAGQLKGKSVLITGGASGIGEKSMRAFVEAGAFVTFGDLAEDKAQRLVSELGEQNVAFAKCNVLSWTEQMNLFKLALAKSPSKTIDVVIANAGTAIPDEVYEQREEENGDPKEPNLLTLQTNFIGVVYTVKLALFYFPKQPEGKDRDRSIIITGSMASYSDQPRNPQYNSSKWGVRGLLRSIRVTGPEQGIRINLIAPWFLDTGIMGDEVKAHVRSLGIEFARLEDAAAAYLHLASDNTINGRALAIVPRSVHERGYYDLEKDDAYPVEDLLNKLYVKRPAKLYTDAD